VIRNENPILDPLIGVQPSVVYCCPILAVLALTSTEVHMLNIVQPYLLSIGCFVAVGGLLLVQLLVADIAGLMKGHVPGSAPDASHESFHFRATRAHANTNESVAAFVLLAFAGIALGASAFWVNWLSVAYCAARVAHMVFYWLKLAPLRSLSFIVGLGSLFGLLVVDIAAAL